MSWWQTLEPYWEVVLDWAHRRVILLPPEIVALCTRLAALYPTRAHYLKRGDVLAKLAAEEANFCCQTVCQTSRNSANRCSVSARVWKVSRQAFLQRSMRGSSKRKEGSAIMAAPEVVCGHKIGRAAEFSTSAPPMITSGRRACNGPAGVVASRRQPTC